MLNEQKHDAALTEWLQHLQWPAEELKLPGQAASERMQRRLQRHLPVRRRISLATWSKIAAAVTGLLIMAGIAWHQQSNQYIVYQSPYGETQRIVLPDQSIATLNANSKIKYRPGLGKGKDVREVWIEGECFFEIEKDNNPFVVHSGPIDVRVLGTAFNVSSHCHRTEVMLEHGKVQLNAEGLAQPLEMSPGELATYDDRHHEVKAKVVNTGIYTAWTHNLLVFEATPLPDVATRIRRTYGFEVDLISDGLEKLQFTGSYPMDEPHLLFEALAKAFDLKILMKKDYIGFESRPDGSE